MAIANSDINSHGLLRETRLLQKTPNCSVITPGPHGEAEELSQHPPEFQERKEELYDPTTTQQKELSSKKKRRTTIQEKELSRGIVSFLPRLITTTSVSNTYEKWFTEGIIN